MFCWYCRMQSVSNGIFLKDASVDTNKLLNPRFGNSLVIGV